MGDRREYLQRASKACNTPNLFPSPPQGGPFSGRQKQHFSAYYIIKFKLIMTIKMMIAMMIMVIILIIMVMKNTKNQTNTMVVLVEIYPF